MFWPLKCPGTSTSTVSPVATLFLTPLTCRAGNLTQKFLWTPEQWTGGEHWIWQKAPWSSLRGKRCESLGLEPLLITKPSCYIPTMLVEKKWPGVKESCLEELGLSLLLWFSSLKPPDLGQIALSLSYVSVNLSASFFIFFICNIHI